jgi:hypothetical protein
MAVVLRMVVHLRQSLEWAPGLQRLGSAERRAWVSEQLPPTVKRWLKYYRLGPRRGWRELQSKLTSLVYHHCAGPEVNHGRRVLLVEELLQAFYIEALQHFREEHRLPEHYTPGSPAELAQYLAYSENYATRPVRMRSGTEVPLIRLRARRASQDRLNREVPLDLAAAEDTALGEPGALSDEAMHLQQVREAFASQDPREESERELLRQQVIASLSAYLEERGQSEALEYLRLQLEHLEAPAIEEALGLDAPQRIARQQRLAYHVNAFATRAQPELVHAWLDAGLEQRLGLSTAQWAVLSQDDLDRRLLELKVAGASNAEIEEALRLAPAALEQRWTRILAAARQLRKRRRKVERSSAAEPQPGGTAVARPVSSARLAWSGRRIGPGRPAPAVPAAPSFISSSLQATMAGAV